MSLMHTALGNGIAAYLTGEKSASDALADIEAAYTTAAKEAGVALRATSFKAEVLPALQSFI